jgi:tetratricopeptide (TPR) repeat protein
LRPDDKSGKPAPDKVDAIVAGIEDRLRRGFNAFSERAHNVQQSHLASAGASFWRCLAKQINALRGDLKFALAPDDAEGPPHAAQSGDKVEEQKAKQLRQVVRTLVANHAMQAAGHALPVDFNEFTITPALYGEIVNEVTGILENYIRKAESEGSGDAAASDGSTTPPVGAPDGSAQIQRRRRKITRIVEKWSSPDDFGPFEALCGLCKEDQNTVPADMPLRGYTIDELAKITAAEPLEDWPPFYRDEVMWLYNECGVFSLAQGNVHDAHALLERALDHARRIEGQAGGPMRHRLLLNRGLAALHRGRIAEARRDFEEALSADEDTAIRHIAMGYLGSCLHLDAQLEAAASHYERALDRLVALPRLRAASIVARNLADLYWHQERPDAKDMYETSVRLAFAAGSVDLVHLHRTGQTRVLRQDTSNIANLREARRFLEEAEKYANQMDLPYLLADVLNAHADIQLAHRDAKAAAIYATRALRIARLSGLRLRKLAFLEGITRIYRERGEVEAAERLLERVLQSARDIGYRILAERAFREKRILLS